MSDPDRKLKRCFETIEDDMLDKYGIDLNIADDWHDLDDGLYDESFYDDFNDSEFR